MPFKKSSAGRLLKKYCSKKYVFATRMEIENIVTKIEGLNKKLEKHNHEEHPIKYLYHLYNLRYYLGELLNRFVLNISDLEADFIRKKFEKEIEEIEKEIHKYRLKLFQNIEDDLILPLLEDLSVFSSEEAKYILNVIKTEPYIKKLYALWSNKLQMQAKGNTIFEKIKNSHKQRVQLLNVFFSKFSSIPYPNLPYIEGLIAATNHKFFDYNFMKKLLWRYPAYDWIYFSIALKHDWKSKRQLFRFLDFLKDVNYILSKHFPERFFPDDPKILNTINRNIFFLRSIPSKLLKPTLFLVELDKEIKRLKKDGLGPAEALEKALTQIMQRSKFLKPL